MIRLFFASTVTYAGFEAYLVGGCVRDLLLKKIPKDYDVITTATLKQVFLHCYKYPP